MDRSAELMRFISSGNLNLIVSNKGHAFNNRVIVNILKYMTVHNKEVYMYCFKERRSYYLSKLISLMSGININVIHNYINPCDSYDSFDKNILNENEYNNYLNCMKKIIESNLLICQYSDSYQEQVMYNDPCDNILYGFSGAEECYTEIIIIDSLSLLIENSKYSEKEIIEKIKDYEKKHKVKFLIFDVWESFASNEAFDNVITLDEKDNKTILNNNQTNTRLVFEFDS